MPKPLRSILLVIAVVATGLGLSTIRLNVRQPTPEPGSNAQSITVSETGMMSPSPVQETYKPPEPVFTAAIVIAASNEYRQKRGLAALTESAVLDRSACAKAADMETRDYWSHATPDGAQPWVFFSAQGYNYQTAGENLAYGQRTARSVVDQWIKSPEHEKNLVGDYTETGVCVLSSQHYQGGRNILTVAHYGRPR